MKVIRVADLAQIKAKGFGINADDNNGKSSYYFVVDEDGGNKEVALFDLRDAINSIKQMSIYYSEEFFSQYSLDSIEGAIEKMVDVLDCIFEFIQELLCTKWGRAKIYSQNRGEGMIFRVLADQVKALGIYKVSYYSKWIDIELIEV
jgi:hypothetical protein